MSKFVTTLVDFIRVIPVILVFPNQNVPIMRQNTGQNLKKLHACKNQFYNI